MSDMTEHEEAMSKKTTETTSETTVEKPVLEDPAEQYRVVPQAPVETHTETTETTEVTETPEMTQG